MNFESQKDYEQYIGREAQEQIELENSIAQSEYENEMAKSQNVVFAQIEKAQDALSALCKNPSSFTMRVPADEDKDTDLIIAKALRYANQMRIALDKIVNSPTPFNERELQSWYETARDISLKALSSHSDIVVPVKSLDTMDF